MISLPSQLLRTTGIIVKESNGVREALQNDQHKTIINHDKTTKPSNKHHFCDKRHQQHTYSNIYSMPLFQSNDDDSSGSVSSSSNNRRSRSPRQGSGWFAKHIPLLSQQRRLASKAVATQTYEQIRERWKEYRTTASSSSTRHKNPSSAGVSYPPVASFSRDEVIVGATLPLESQHSNSSNSSNKKRQNENQRKKPHFAYYDVTGIRILLPDSTDTNMADMSMSQYGDVQHIGISPEEQHREGVTAFADEEEARYKIAAQAFQVARRQEAGTTTTNSINETQKLPHRYMMKQVHPDCWDDDQDWFQAISHLVRETEVLKDLSQQHHNLLTVRGTTHGDEVVFLDTATVPQWDSYFVMTDRISETLAQRIDRWRHESKDSPTEITIDQQQHYPLLETKLLNPLHPTIIPTARCPIVGDEDATMNAAFRTRLVYAQNMASALAFLHSKQIIVRNLHPELIGFLTSDDTLQLMDLGQALHVGGGDRLSEARSSRSVMSPATMLQQQQEEALFQMTPGNVMRYLAPELLTALLKTSNCGYGVDSYSWAMVCFEMFTLSEPFATLKAGQHLHHVCLEQERSKPLRPHLSIYQFPKPLKHLLQGAWHHDVKRRYKMVSIDRLLQKLLSGEVEEKAKANETKVKGEKSRGESNSEKVASIPELKEEFIIEFPRHRHQIVKST